MAARERRSSRVTCIDVVPCGRRWNRQVQIDRLHGIRSLIEQTLGESVEDPIGCSHDCLALTGNVVSESNTRRKVFPVFLEDRRLNARVAMKEQTDGRTRRNRRLQAQLERYQSTVQIVRR